MVVKVLPMVLIMMMVLMMVVVDVVIERILTCYQRLVHVVKKKKIEMGGLQLPHTALLHPADQQSGSRRARIKDCSAAFW